jgi:uncharacterized protein (DUF2141 family)
MTVHLWRRTAGLSVVLAFLALLPAIAQADDCAGTPSGDKATVVIDNVHTSQGLMAATLYREKGFLRHGGSMKVWRAPAHAGTQTMCVWLPSPGVYAIGIYQDLNSDHKIDYTLLGPTEPWAFTQNPHELLALPRFSQVRFTAGPGNTTLHVKMNYPK